MILITRRNTMSLIGYLTDRLFPNYCQMCHNPMQGAEGICDTCITAFPFISLTQPNLLYQPSIAREFNLPYCHGLLACGWYESFLKTWLSQFKFAKQSHYQLAISSIIKTQLAMFNQANIFIPDVFIILPLHNYRLISRGFNQVAQTWGPCLPAAQLDMVSLKRARLTKPQSRLNLKQRKQNTKSAFQVERDLADLKVAIIDDVITTGSTMNAAAKACCNAGAKEVWAFTTALTPLHRQSVSEK